MKTCDRLQNALALVAIGVALAGCSGKTERIASHLENGEAYFRVADLDKASVEVRNVLQMDPKSAEAYYLSGRIEESKREMQRAYSNYVKALELNPAYASAKTGIARIYLIVGDLPRADASITEILASDPSSTEARILKAALLARRGDTEGAVAEAQRLESAAGPIPTNASLLLAGLYASQRDDGKALAVIERALRSDPRDLDLLGVAAELNARLNATDKAASYLKTATDVAPKNFDLWRAWARLYDQLNLPEKAEKVLRDAIASQPDESERYLALVEWLNARKGRDAAAKELLAEVAARPRDYAIRFALVDHFRTSNRPSDAERTLREIIENDRTGPSGLRARNELAVFDLNAGRTAEARALFDDVIKSNPRDGTALLQRGQMKIAAGDPKGAIADLRSVAKDRPDSAVAVGLLAQAHLADAEPQLARDVIADAVKLFPASADLGLLQSEFLVQTGDRDGALAAVDQVIRNSPKNPRAYQVKSSIQFVGKDAKGAEATLQKLSDEFKGDPIGPMALGRLYLLQKNYEAAVVKFDEATKLAPLTSEPRISAIKALVAAGRFDEATRRVEAAIQAEPGKAENYQTLGEVKIAQGAVGPAEAAFRLAVEASPTAPGGYVGLARVLMARKDVDGALAVFDRGIAANPADTTLAFAKAEVFSRSGQNDKAIAVYEAILKQTPNSDVAANNAAFLLTEFKGDKPSLERALRLTEKMQSSTNPGYLDSLGWVRYKLGQYDQAVPVLQRAVKLSPDSPLLRLHLGMALYKAGDVATAKQHLKIATQSDLPLPNIEEARKIVARG